MVSSVNVNPQFGFNTVIRPVTTDTVTQHPGDRARTVRVPVMDVKDGKPVPTGQHVVQTLQPVDKPKMVVFPTPVQVMKTFVNAVRLNPGDKPVQVEVPVMTLGKNSKLEPTGEFKRQTLTAGDKPRTVFFQGKSS